ncbi:MAG: C40 family peptidase [Fermentimonas sp.]|jgi:lipoprotein Spr
MLLKSTYLKAVVNTIYFIAITLLLASCGSNKTTVNRSPKTSPIQDDIVAFSKQYLGRPYGYSSKGPKSFDCSGFTYFVFKNFGYNLGASSSDQDRQAKTIDRRDKLQKGDLVFFEGRVKNGKVGHVGIVTDIYPNGNFRFIHASTSNGVIYTKSTEPYYASRYLRGGRILEDNASYATKIPNSKTKNDKVEWPNVKNKNQQTSEPQGLVLTEYTNQENNEYESTVVVQTNPLKNPPLEGKHNTIPNKAKKDSAIRRETEVVPTPANYLVHTTLPGETLFSISKKYGCSISQIRDWNPNITDVLKAGEKIIIYNN